MRFLYILTLLLFNSALTFAANIHFEVKTVGLGSMLPSNAVNTMYQDRNGILWIGTADGVCRYDGYRVFTFRSSSKDIDLLPNNDVRAINENDNYYFIGTTKGLCLLDKRTYKTKTLPFRELKDYEVRSIVTDHNGNIWVGTYKRLVRLSADLSECKTYDKRGLPITSVNSVYRDKQGRVWVMFWNKGLYLYNPKTDRFSKMPKVGEKDNPFRLFEDSKGRIIASTWGNGLFLVYKSGKNFKLKPLACNPKHKEQLGMIFGITQDSRNGYLCMAGSLGFVMAKLENGFLNVYDIDTSKYGISNVLSGVFKDNNGDVWVLSQNGHLSLISFNAATFVSYPLEAMNSQFGYTPDINAMLVSGNGLVWLNQLGLGPGAYTFGSGQLTMIKRQPESKKYPEINDITMFFAPSWLKQRVWAIPKFYSIIYELSYANGRINVDKVYDLRNKISGMTSYICEDARHNIWWATNFGVVAKPFARDFVKTGIKTNDIVSIASTSDGDVWLGSKSKGVMRVRCGTRGNGFAIKDTTVFNTGNTPLTTNHIASVCTDLQEKKVWIATTEGAVVVYDTATGKFADMSATFESYINNEVRNIFVDRYGYVWLTTTKSILKYDGKANTVNVYSADDNLAVSSFNKNVISFSPDYNSGLVYFGGYGGIVGFDGRQPLYTSLEGNMPIVSDIKINGLSIFSGTFDYDDNSLDNENKTIRLGSNVRNIELDFTSLNYRNPNKIMFAYKLEGVDHDWVYATDNKSYAYYNNLSKGEYRLLVKATDANGRWSDKTTEYKLVREPAFYETWWANTLYIIALAAAMRWFYLNAKRRIRMRNELYKTQLEKRKEEELTQAKLRYFTNVSHDFLTPITVISCIIEDMRMSYKGDMPQLGRISFNLTKLKRLIQQVLDFRKLEHGEMKLQVSEGDLVAFMRNICSEYFEPLMQKKNLKFTWQCDETEFDAWFDADKLEKIVTNLLSNAYKYTDEGTITASLKREGGHAIICVSDTGRGMSEKDAANIFKRFYTVDHASANSNGIGMSLVKELADLHHASITVDSQLGKGTTFTLTLPIAEADYPAEEKSPKADIDKAALLELPVPTATATPIDSGDSVDSTAKDDKTMMIVEDNNELRGLMVRIFSRYHNVVQASDGQEAYEMITTGEQPDIIISDVMMPRLDGLELCRRLKSDINTSHIPVILLTARTTSEDQIECYNAGADGYVAKPFELNVLKARIDSFLRKRAAKQQEFKEDKKPEPEKLDMSPIDRRFIDNVIEYITKHITDETLDINELSRAMFMSKSSLYRKLKSLTDLSPVEFVRNIRLKRAYQLLQSGEKTVSEVAYECGFSTPRYFSTCFKTEFGMTPTDFMKGNK